MISLTPQQAAGLHTFFEVMSFFVGYQYYAYLRKSGDAISYDNRLTILAGAAVGALVFSRVIGLLEDPQLFIQLQEVMYYFQHKTIVGGLAGGLLGVEVTKKILGEKRSSGDLFVLPLLLAMIVGRLGCLLTGLHDGTVGLVTAMPWGIDFGDGLMRHPTSLYEIVYLVLLSIAVKKWFLSGYKNWPEGYAFRFFMMAYMLFRFFIEELKPVYPLGPFTAIQWTCLVVLIYYVSLFFRRKTT